MLFLAREANVKLRSRCVLSVGRCPNNVSENSHRAIQRRRNRDAKDFQLLPGQINFADTKLCLDCFIEVRAGRISFDQLAIRVGRWEIIMQLFLQLRRAIQGTGRKSIFGIPPHNVLIRVNRSFHVALLFGTLPNLIQL